MASYKRFSQNLASGFWVVAMIALWLAFAPTQAGGLASYIVVIGNSMEPKFHIGDLVVVHEEARYQAGDAVVYRNQDLENYVFHRIVEEELERFTLQGDNNSWTDEYQPARDEIIGKLWLHIPKGGSVLQNIRNPYIMAGIAGVLGLILATGFLGNKPKGRKHMEKDWFTSIKQKLRDWFTSSGGSEPPKAPSNQGILLEGSFFFLGLVAFASIVLGIISFSRPTTRTVKNDVVYDQLGIFAYSASAPQGVYDANAVKSGDPIFPKLTCVVDVTFQYTLIAQKAENISGTYQLTAVIAEPAGGWQRMVPLQDEAVFSGNSVGTNAKLDLCKIEEIAESLEQTTDFRPSSYTLTVSPNIKVTGTISGRALDATFDPELQFRYDRVRFYIQNDDQQGDTLNLTETSILSNQRTEANTMRLIGMEPAISTLRLIAVIGLVASLGGLLFLSMRLQNLSNTDPASFIRTRYEAMMIDIQSADMIDASTLVEVSSIEDLAKLAERFNAMILHAEFSQAHAYYVQTEGTMYRFVLNSQKTGSAVPKNEATGLGGGM